ncbi:MAG: hypothetical protein IKF96_08195 [Eggerthellaceae bacterium]|nr:hypothetical protein [Eggerthellaceae bacterium]MBR3258951.1 hypothetical protein [Eggerthellaceae bacterium]
MKVIVTYVDGKVTVHNTAEYASQQPWPCQNLATSYLVHTEDLSKGLWVQVVYHDMDAALNDDIFVEIEPWLVANPTPGMKLWLVPKEDIEEVKSIKVEDRVVWDRLIGGGHLVNMVKYDEQRRAYLGSQEMSEFDSAALLHFNIAADLDLNPDDSESVQISADAMGWHPDDLALAIERRRALREAQEALEDAEEELA